MSASSSLAVSASSSNENVALIAGATGMAGLALAEALKSPSAPGGPWTVYAAARRPPVPGTIFPPVNAFLQFDAIDAAVTAQALGSLSGHVTNLFWVCLANRDNEEANIADNTLMLANILAALLSGTAPRLRHVTLQTGTKHYMGPNIDPIRLNRVGRMEVPFYENSPRVAGPNFYYAQEDLLDSHARRYPLTWTVHRSSIIIGASCRSAYNLLMTLAVYALIARREGEPFVYPGTVYTWRHFCDASDAEVLAAQQLWAAEEAAAGRVGPGEAFNCTNGDVYTWRSFWKAVAAEFKVGFVECESDGEGFAWVDRMRRKGPVWDAIVEEERLVPNRLEEVTSFTAVCSVLSFGFQHVCSMNKSREFGFYKSVDTIKSVRKWVARLREMNIIPKIN